MKIVLFELPTVSEGDNFYAQRNQYTSSQIDQLFAGSADTDYFGINGGAFQTARQNYFGRFNYTYNDRYMAQFHFRYDGSSNFPSNKRFGFFPGVSVGWRISEESFLKNNAIVSNLKLRASWGKLGNDRIDAFQYLNILAYPDQPSQGYVIGGGNVNVLNPGVAANPNVTWETKSTLDIGVDAGFLENRLTLEFDIFSENRKDILAYRNATVPNYTGLILPRENISEVDNKGFDTQIMYRGKVSDVSFNIGGNMSFAKNKIIFADDRDIFATEEQYKRQSLEGHPVGAALVYDYIGVYRTAEDIAQYPALTPAQPGDPIFRDLNGDGELNNQDKYRLDRTSVPQFQYGITLGGQYKGFDLTVLFQGSARAIQFVRYTFNEGNNGLEYFLKNAWNAENPDASLPAFNKRNTDNDMSTLWRRDVSFLRLKNIELGYTLPKSLVSKVGIENLRFYLNGFNLLTFDKLKKDGMSDPEATNIEAWQFPHTKSINFGLNLTL